MQVLEVDSLPPAAAPQETLGSRTICVAPPDGTPPLFVRARSGAFEDTQGAIEWVEKHLADIRRFVTEYGAIVLRGFPIATVDDFSMLSGVFPQYTGGYQGGAAARQKIGDRVYEASQLSGSKKIKLHQEMYYLSDYPHILAFFARIVADQGGETIIGDMRRFSRSLPPSIASQLRDKGVQYVRNFAAPSGSHVQNDHIDLRGWDFAFYTNSKEEVEQVCDKRGLQPIWNEDGSLTVVNELQSFETHPSTQQDIYRAGIHFSYDLNNLDPNSLDAAVRDQQTRPTGVYLGGGSELTSDEQKLLVDLMDEVTIEWKWETGDVLLVDNLQVAHGRNPFQGNRETMVAMLQ